MERLTERLTDGYIKIQGCKTIYGNKGCKSNPVTNAIVRLAEYEDTGRMPEEIMALIPSPNDPLTLDELREMDGEPVWVVFTPDADGECLTMWALISVDRENDEIFLQNNIGGSSAYEEIVEDIMAIYRRRPEEGTT